jgi:hypothetical protein
MKERLIRMIHRVYKASIEWSFLIGRSKPFNGILALSTNTDKFELNIILGIFSSL